MKVFLFIMCLSLTRIAFSQPNDTLKSYEIEYNTLIKYVPSGFSSDSATKHNYVPSRFGKLRLNSIGRLQMVHAYKDMYGLTKDELDSLDNRIDQIASALFQDGKRILITPAGGYGGCPAKRIDTITLHGLTIINLKFCHTCTDSWRDKNFIQIFNNRMYQLMKILPPDDRTRLFVGEYTGKFNKQSQIVLDVSSDRSYSLYYRDNKEARTISGFWSNEFDTLTLGQGDPTLPNSMSPFWSDEDKTLHFVLSKKGLDAYRDKEKVRLKKRRSQ